MPASTLPPGPRLPAALQLVRMSMDPYGFLEECRARYGDLFTIHMPGGERQVFVSDPESVRALTTGGYDDFLRDAEAVKTVARVEGALLAAGFAAADAERAISVVGMFTIGHALFDASTRNEEIFRFGLDALLDGIERDQKQPRRK